MARYPGICGGKKLLVGRLPDKAIAQIGVWFITLLKHEQKDRVRRTQRKTRKSFGHDLEIKKK